MSPKPPSSAERRLTPDGAFVVQFEAGTDLGAGSVGGRVEHVQTGRAAQFASLDELLGFVGTVLAQVERARH